MLGRTGQSVAESVEHRPEVAHQVRSQPPGPRVQKAWEGMKQGFEGTSGHAAYGEHAGDPLWLPDRGFEGDVDARRPADDHRPVDAVRVHHREKVVGVIGNADPRLVGGAFGSAETAMVPRHHAVGVGPAVDVRPRMVRSAEPLGDQHGHSVTVVVPCPQPRPINGCDRSIPQRRLA
jgi:hypothetical protein